MLQSKMNHEDIRDFITSPLWLSLKRKRDTNATKESDSKGSIFSNFRDNFIVNIYASRDIQTDQQQGQGSQLDDSIVPNSLIAEKEGQQNNNETVAEEVGSKKAFSYSFPAHRHVVALLCAFLCLLVANQVTIFM